MRNIKKKTKKTDIDEEIQYSTDALEAAEEEQEKFHKTVMESPRVGAEYDEAKRHLGKRRSLRKT